ncbi:hypothetical protein [Streptococcus mitis]|uniref:hypothetical protein n=1 Tax=Streptococcus mitis TaxID=28037 RepID=UPI00398BD85C
MVKLFDLCYSEYAWDGLSKWFIKQFYFTKTIVTMQKSNGKSVVFLGNKGLLSQTPFIWKLRNEHISFLVWRNWL